MSNTVRSASLPKSLYGTAAAVYGLDVAVVREYLPKLAEVAELDNGGEPCGCQQEGHDVEVQWYGRTVGGEQAHGECCRGCLGRSLNSAVVDPHAGLTVEVAVCGS